MRQQAPRDYVGEALAAAGVKPRTASSTAKGPNGNHKQPRMDGKWEIAESYEWRPNGELAFDIRRYVMGKLDSPKREYQLWRPAAEPNIWIWGYAAGEFMRLKPGQNWVPLTEKKWEGAPALTRQRQHFDGIELPDMEAWTAAGHPSEALEAIAGKPKAQQATADEIAEMNRNYAVVSVGGKTRVVSLADPREITFSTFEDFRNYHLGIGERWLKNPSRRQYAGITFAPGLAPEIHGKLNLWRGFAVEPKKGDCSKFLAHVRDNICSGDAAIYEYLIDVMADAVQNPNKQGEVCVAVRGLKGVGKGKFILHFGSLFGPHFAHVSEPSQLAGKFNAHLEQCCVLFGDECFWAGNHEHEGTLKRMITEPSLMIERKGVDAIQVPNRLHVYLSANAAWVVPASADERRFLMLDVGDKHRQDYSYFGAIDAQMENGGRGALLYFLLNRKITHNLRQVPQTEGLAKQKALSRRGVDRLVETIAHEGAVPARHWDHASVAITSGSTEKDKDFYEWARRAVPDLKHTANATISRALADEWGCRRVKSGSIRGLRFPDLAELRAKFDEKHGPQEWPADTDSDGHPIKDGGEWSGK